MAGNRIFPAIIGPALTGVVDLAADDMLIVLVADSYTWAAATFLDEVDAGDRVGAAAPVTGTRSWTGGSLIVDEPEQTLTAVSGDPIAGWLYVMDGATDADRRLVGHVARGADTTPVHAVPDGSDVKITLPGGVILTIGGG